MRIVFRTTIMLNYGHCPLTRCPYTGSTQIPLGVDLAHWFHKWSHKLSITLGCQGSEETILKCLTIPSASLIPEEYGKLTHEK